MANKRWLWLCGLLAAVTLTATVTRADADDQARDRYERALSLYEDGVYDAALVELRRAYELRPSYKLLYNIGQVRLALKDYAGALETYRQYLRDGGGQIPAARVEAVQKEIARLEQRVARLEVQVDVPGAEVAIDDVLVGTTPLAEPVLVNSGVRRVTVRHPDHPPQTARVSIAGGEAQVVPVSLAGRSPASTRAEPSKPAPTVEQTPPAPVVAKEEPLARAQAARRAKVTAWTAWSVTGALGLTAVGLAVGAKLKEGKLEDARGEVGAGTAPENARELDDLKQQTERLALTTDVFTGVAVVAAGVSLWLTLRARRHGDESADKAAAARTHVDVGLTRIQLRTEF